MKCKNCGEEIASNSKFCEHCGTKIMKVGKKGAILWLWGCVAFLIGVVIWTIQVHNDNETADNKIGQNWYDVERVKNTIETHNKAYAENDFVTISSVYSDKVSRYHNAYGLSNSEVVEKYKNYDKKFGVYGKHINVRWNTLQIERISDDELSVIYVEDYRIDRYDTSQCSIYILKHHLILDSDYKIKSIYDNHL